MARNDLILTLISSEKHGAIRVVDLLDGWPSIIECQTASGPRTIAVHISTVSPHARGEHEFRFQNPGSSVPVTSPAGTYPALVGVFSESGQEPIFVGVDGSTRVGRTKRFSILFQDTVLKKARQSGWATYISSTGEKMVAFRGEFAPVFLDALVSGGGVAEQTSNFVDEIEREMDAEAPETSDAAWGLRARRMASRVVRLSGFARNVLRIDRFRCVLCGISGPLLQAAHIYPASAPESPDSVSNGLTMCANHHAIFDAHLIAIVPGSGQVTTSPELQKLALENAALSTFIAQTVQAVTPGTRRPEEFHQMIARRLAYFSTSYQWLET